MLVLNKDAEIKWTIDNTNYYYWDFDKLYDLIKLGIIEKAEGAE